MHRDLISVIIPVYNVGTYVSECIKSVIKQTYRNLEILIVNDGSTDNSLEICRECSNQDSRIKIIDKENEGLSKARQTGIDMSNGTYFVTVDSDDYVAETFVEELYKCIVDKESDISVCGRYDFTTSEIREIPLSKEAIDKKIDSKDIEEEYFDLLSRYVMSDSWNKMYRRDFVNRSGVTFLLDNKYNGTDLLFNHLLLLHQPLISTVDKPLYFHRNNTNSRVYRKNKKMMEGFMFITDEIIKEADRLEIGNKINIQLSKLYLRFQNLASVDIYFSHDDDSKLVKEYRDFIQKNMEYISKTSRISLNNIPTNRTKEFIIKTTLKNNNPYILIFYNYGYSILKQINRTIKKIKYKK